MVPTSSGIKEKEMECISLKETHWTTNIIATGTNAS